MIEKDFPPHVAEICRAALALGADALVAWARQRFGQPAPTDSRRSRRPRDGIGDGALSASWPERIQASVRAPGRRADIARRVTGSGASP